MSAGFAIGQRQQRRHKPHKKPQTAGRGFDIPQKGKQQASHQTPSSPPLRRAAAFSNGQPAPDPVAVVGKANDLTAKVTYAIVCGLMRHGHLHKLPNGRKWMQPIAKMLETTTLPINEIRSVLKWYFEEGLFGTYTPKAYCTQTIVDKFGAIRSAYVAAMKATGDVSTLVKTQPKPKHQANSNKPQWVFGDFRTVPCPPDDLPIDRQDELWDLYNDVEQTKGRNLQAWVRYKLAMMDR